jgi:hypothetical protein
MSTRAIIFFGLSLVSVVIALIIFFTKFYTFLAFLFLVLGAAAVLFFRQGMAEMKKKGKS